MVRRQEENIDVESGLVHRENDFVNDGVNEFSGLVRSSSQTFANTRVPQSPRDQTSGLLRRAELPMYSDHSGLLVAKLLMLC